MGGGGGGGGGEGEWGDGGGWGMEGGGGREDDGCHPSLANLLSWLKMIWPEQDLRVYPCNESTLICSGVYRELL